MPVFVRFLVISGLASSVPTLCHAQQIDPAPETSQHQPSNAWRLSLGVNYSTGDYDSLVGNTDVVSVPVSLRYRSGGFSFKLSVPYVHVNGPGSLLDTPQGGGSDGGDGDGDEDDAPETGGTPLTPAMQSRSGIGDVALTAAYSLPLGSDFYLDANGRIKLPTASTVKRLGSGEVDYSGGLELGYDDGAMGYYISGRRRFIGNSATSNRRDVWGLATGFSASAAPWLRLGADYGWSQSTRASGGTISEVTGWASFRLSRAVRLQVYAATGLSAASANFASGATASLRF